MDAREFEYKLRSIRSKSDVDVVKHKDSNQGITEFDEVDSLKDEHLRRFTLDLNDWNINELTDSLVENILKDIPFISVPDDVLTYFMKHCFFRGQIYAQLLDWIVDYSNEHLWEYDRVSIKWLDAVSTFLIKRDYKTIADIPSVLNKENKVEIHRMTSKVGAVKITKAYGSNYGESNYYVLPTNEHLYEGLTVLPQHAKFYRGMILKDCTVYSPFVASEENDYTLQVSGVVRILADTPIVACDHVIIKGTPCSKLTLINTSVSQPCIGPETIVDLPDVRYQLASRQLKEIIIDTVDVECWANNPNFSIGAYGYEEVPVVVCKNEGRLNCPETEGIRVLKKHVTIQGDSTKCMSDPEYQIVRKEDTPVNSLSGECKEILREICGIRPELANKVTYKTTDRNLSLVLEILRIKSSCNVDVIIAGVPDSKQFMYRTMSILGMPMAGMEIRQEFEFEELKLEWITRTFFGIEDDYYYYSMEYALNLIYFMREHFEWDKYLMNILYELIPTFDFNCTRSKTADVDNYLRDRQMYMSDRLQERLNNNTDKIKEHFGFLVYKA